MYYSTSEKIISMLSDISSELEEIKESQRRLETHNSFITRVYFMMRDPIISVFNTFLQSPMMLTNGIRQPLISEDSSDLENGIHFN
jgi:hypothetical protein